MSNITVVGIGYVGLSLALLLAQKNNVTVIDINQEKVKALNERTISLNDKEIMEYLAREDIHIEATINEYKAYDNADFIIIATSTDYNQETNSLDTSSIERVLTSVLAINPKATIIIKSTIPFGYTNRLKRIFKIDNLIFVPEFLREGKALYDNLYPSRIIVGDKSERAIQFVKLLTDGALKENVPVLFTNSEEAEIIKLFSNAYLALRIAFFNEIDTFAEYKNLSAQDVINGICLDSRIGDYYNNPSFGYGGYCLPKDTKQLSVQYQGIPNNLIDAIIESNVTRKHHIVEMVLRDNPKVVGIYRLVMKQNSDNFRESAILYIINSLKREGIEIVIYEPLLRGKYFEDYEIVEDISILDDRSDIILANRLSKETNVLKKKVYSRDVFGID